MPLPRILINEDSESDQQLILAEFSRVQFPCETHCVSTREAFRQALDAFSPDLILSDYSLAGYDGLDAIAMAKARCPDVPIVILTIALNEETAVECMKRGATDYVLKNRLPSIVPIVASILERRSMAQEKARLQLEHEQLFKLTPNLFCVADLSGALKEVNPAWTSRLGYSPEQLIDRPLTQLAHPGDRDKLAQWWQSLASTAPQNTPPRECECRLLHRDGTLRYLVWNATPFPGDGKIYAYGHDVTAHRHAESALRESEERFRAMADSAPVFIWITDANRQFTYFNRPRLEFTGCTLQQEIANNHVASVHPDDVANCHEVFTSSFASHQPFRMIYRLRRRDGVYRWMLDHGTPRYDAHNAFVGYIGSSIDITEQHEAESALTQRAIKQTALVNFGSFALARHPFSTLLAGAARTVADTLGIEYCYALELSDDRNTLSIAASANPQPDELGRTFGAANPSMLSGRVLLLPDDDNIFPGAATLAGRGVRSGIAVLIGSGDRLYGLLTAASQETRNFTGDTASFLQSIANVLSTVHARNCAEAALAESEQKLLQSQKMEAVGLLAGGVAHDFNNLLTAIRCYGEILHDDLAEQAPGAQAKTAEILRATARASALTRQLLAFSRKQVVQPEILDLNQVVNDLNDLLRSLLSENIVFETQLHPDYVNVSADRSQIEQVLINLAINARDAMPQGGRLTLGTTRRHLAEGDPDLRELPPGAYCAFFVSDTGIGMSPEVQSHLFEPFFTTKPKGRGTGLGLATCSVVLKNINGAIRCSSQLGQGTTFTVLIPEVIETELKFEPSEDDTPLGRCESILLVEDDDAVRAVTESILRSLGYEVHVEPGGAEAIALCLGENPPKFDLLLTDIVMPYIGGHELAERITSLRPDIKILFMSGYVDDPMIIQAVQNSHVPFLEKPFNRTQLAKKVREAIEGR